MKEESNKALKELIQKALDNPGMNTEALKHKSLDEILETLSIYQQELEYQNKELARSYEQIEATSKRFQELFDEAPIGYLVVDQNSSILSCNKKCEKLFRKSKHEIIGQRIPEFIFSDYQDEWYLFFRKAWKEKEKDFMQM